MAGEFLDDLVARFVADADDLAQAQRLAVTLAGGGEAGARAYLDLCRLVGESASDTAGLLAALDDLADAPVIDHIGALVIACFAAVRADYAARQDAQAARNTLAARAGAVFDPAGEAFGADMLSFLVRLSGEAAIQISAVAATRAPLVRVETGLSLPSSLLAYDLYGDPARGEELVARNRSATPLVMPIALEALAS
ncbi:MAG: hypothetical protein AB1698_03510 [Pseudomonadota bacterium]